MIRSRSGPPAPPRRLGALLAAALLAAPDFALVARAAEFRSLEGIEVGKDQVTVLTDSPVRYRSFLTQTPPRLVVDLYDTQHRVEAKERKGSGKLIRKVRSGQYQSEPRVSRVVMDLAQVAAYEVVSVPNGLRILLGGEAGAAAKAMTGQAVQGPVRLFRDAPEEKMVKVGETPGEIPTEIKVGLPATAAPKAPARAARQDIMGSLPKEKINLDFDSADIRDIIKLLGVRAGINIIYGSDVAGSLSIHLKRVPFDEAFNTVLHMGGLTTQQVGDNILRILTPEVLKSERGKALPTTRVFTMSYVDAGEMKTQLDAVRGAEGRPGNTVVSGATNAIIVTDTTEGMLQVEQLISKLDRKPQQVLIEAKLIEVQLSKGLDLGIQWDYSQAAGIKGGGRWFTGTNDPGVTSPASLDGDGLGNFGGTTRGTGVFLPASNSIAALTLGRVTNNSFLTATLTAAASQGKAKVLSDPKVATLNKKEASINITTQIPYVTATTASTGVTTQNVSYLTVGIQLTVTPIINADGRITLKINPNVSQPSATAAGAAGSTGAPAVDTRNAVTTVLVRNEETIVIGGLIQDRETETVTKVPFFGDLPIIGFFFRKTSSSRQRQELLVFVTPKIMED